jgi:hypothetical protein
VLTKREWFAIFRYSLTKRGFYENRFWYWNSWV